jgi:hypothetical protein
MKRLLFLLPLISCACSQAHLSLEAAKAYQQGMTAIAPTLASGVVDARAVISEFKELDCVKSDADLLKICDDYLDQYKYDQNDIEELYGADKDFALEIERVESGSTTQATSGTDN